MEKKLSCTGFVLIRHLKKVRGQVDAHLAGRSGRLRNPLMIDLEVSLGNIKIHIKEYPVDPPKETILCLYPQIMLIQATSSGVNPTFSECKATVAWVGWLSPQYFGQ